MPELPEVETVRLGLRAALEGRQLVRVEQRRPDLRFALPERFAARLTGRRVERLNRRAKYLLAELDDGAVLLMHLGMSGSFRIEAVEARTPGDFHHPRSKDPAHDHIVFDTGAARIVYNDPRRFGFMALIAPGEFDSHALLKDLGPEPLGNRFDAAVLNAALHGRAAPLKSALLDQRVVAGLGNIYVCEALYRARLSPRRKAGSIATAKGPPGKRVERLVAAIREVLREAIAAGGSSLRDHRRADGELGYFQHAFKVYDREGQPCSTPGCGGTVARIVQSGRSTFLCTACQR
jgi:formamidopyrimidine-DNA glycosylase